MNHRFTLRPAFMAPLAAALITHAAAENWPQYRGPAANGATTEKIQTTWPADGPKKLWHTPTPGGFSSFAVAKNRAFTLVLREVQGVPTEVCLALDAETGRELWATPLS